MNELGNPVAQMPAAEKLISLTDARSTIRANELCRVYE